MECKVAHKELERGKRLLIADVDTFGGKALKVVEYFESLPKRWDIKYFYSGEELRQALECGDIHNDLVAVLPSDEGLLPSRIYGLGVKQNVKRFINRNTSIF